MMASEQKTSTIMIDVFLAFSMTASLMLVPIVNAHSPPWTIPTYAYLSVEPNPIGVGQNAYVNFWLDKVPPIAVASNGVHWHNMTVDVTKPNGEVETLIMPDSDAVGGTWARYVPRQLGIYKFVGKFPGQTVKIENPYPYAPGNIPNGVDFINDTYAASTSKEVVLTVQQENITHAYLHIPPPTNFWQRPINSMSRDYYSVAGNWLGLGATTFGDTGLYDQNGNFNPYTTAPNTAHVVWTKPEAFGGQIGGEFGDVQTGLYATGTAYEAKFSPVILNGLLYYTSYPGAKSNPGPLTAVDIRTGETLWTKDLGASSLRAGMIYNFITGNQYGAHAYLFTAPSTNNGWVLPLIPNKWSMYDAMAGGWILDIDNASAGTLVRGPNGEILSYTTANGMLTMWNSSKCIEEGSTKNNIYVMYSATEIWRPPQGATIDWSSGNEWSVPITANISGTKILPPLGIAKISNDVVLTVAQSGDMPGGAQLGYEIEAGYSAKNGQLLWGPINRTLTPFTNVVQVAAGEGVYTEYTNQEMTFIGYSITTGQKLWGPTQPYNSSWGYYDSSGHGVIGYGNFYVWGLSGEVYAWDARTGVLKWSWYAGNARTDTPYGTWPLGVFGGYDLADGKLYLASGHDYNPPIFKGAKLYSLNATTGEEIWDSLCFSVTSSPAIADGYMVKLNGYDNQVYAYGKGPSAMAVAAQQFGSAIVIRGTVIDKSPGTQQTAPAANFPNGVPAVSDESMSRFMEAVYQQQPMPTNTTGVPVIIKVLDSNGNYREIGTTTSDSSGMFTLTWIPDIPGNFTVAANFAGSDSYYSSYAETSFFTDNPVPTASSNPQVILPPTQMYIAAGVAAIIIAIAIAGAILLMAIRKQP